jgi:uncharacterized cupin superfamily protein
VPEAPLEDGGSGLAPAGEGWFVVNVRDAEWLVTETFGSGTQFESREHRFAKVGFNINVLGPGEPNCLYHREALQEDFLVLAGECLLLVEGEERSLHAWDFVHSPAQTEHIFIGAGDEPCVILMAGARGADWNVLYPVSDLAARHGASVDKETSDPDEAYIPTFEPSRRGRPSYWDRLPWA